MLADLDKIDRRRDAQRAQVRGHHGARTRHESYDANAYYDNAPDSYGARPRWATGHGSLSVHGERLPPDPPLFFLPRPPPPPAPPFEAGAIIGFNSVGFATGLIILNGLVLLGLYRNRQSGLTKLTQSEDVELGDGAGATGLPPSADAEMDDK